MPAGITSVEWDEAGQLATIHYARKPAVTFSASQIPQNVPKTVPAYQAWADANVEQLLRAKGFEAYIRIKIRTVDAQTGFVTMEFVILADEDDRDEYVFRDPTPPPPGPQPLPRRARALRR
jgi:hypothetical protein